MRGALVQEQNPWLSVQCSCEQHSLSLPTRKRASHISNQAVIGHWHSHNLFMNAGQLRASDHQALIERWVKEADIVGYGSGQQLILLHYRTYLFAKGSGPNHRKRN